jgi:hypothetical protein
MVLNFAKHRSNLLISNFDDTTLHCGLISVLKIWQFLLLTMLLNICLEDAIFTSSSTAGPNERELPSSVSVRVLISNNLRIFLLVKMIWRTPHRLLQTQRLQSPFSYTTSYGYHTCHVLKLHRSCSSQKSFLSPPPFPVRSLAANHLSSL